MRLQRLQGDKPSLPMGFYVTFQEKKKLQGYIYLVTKLPFIWLPLFFSFL